MTNPGTASSVTNNDQLATQGYVASAITAAAPTHGSLQTLQNTRNRVALIGDSQDQFSFAYINVPTSVGSVVISNGVVTVNTGSNSGTIVGNYIFFFNSADVNFSSPINGIMIPVGSQPTNTQLTFSATQRGLRAPDGDYSNQAYLGGPAGNWTIVKLTTQTDDGWVAWMNAYLRGQFLITSCNAFVGATSQMGVALLPKILSGPAFDIAIIGYGTNDINNAGSASAATAAAITAATNIQNICDQVIAYGAKVILRIPPALPAAAVGGGSTAQYKNQAMLQMVNLLRVYAQSRNNNIWVMDLWKNTILGTSTTGDTVSGYTDGTVHPSGTGCRVFAINESAYLSTILSAGATDLSPMSMLDDGISATYSAQALLSGPNLIQNGLMTGTAGTVAGGATGTAATGWTLTATGGATIAGTGGATRQAVTNTNQTNWGNAQTVAYTFSGAAQGFTFNSSNNGSSLTQGQWYRFGITLICTANCSGLSGVQTVWNFNNVSVSQSPALHQISGAASPAQYQAGDILELVSAPIFVGLAPTNNLLQITATSTGAGSGTFQFASAWVRQIANPYV